MTATIRDVGDRRTWTAALREAVEAAVRKRATEAILLSGGLDTAVLATVRAAIGSCTAVTVVLSGAPQPDRPHSTALARRLGFDHHLVEVDRQRLEAAAGDVVEVLDTWDPMTVRNQAVIAVAFDRIVDLGLGTATTGDGADELFAGYSFYLEMEPVELGEALESLWRVMRFDSPGMAGHWGLEVEAPYLDRRIRDLAEEADPRWLVGERQGRRFGKWPLRVAFEAEIGPGLAWRRKDPIEVGSGATVLPDLYREETDADSFNRVRRRHRRVHGVRLRDPEHLRYFELYLDRHGGPEPAPEGERRCPDCAGAVAEGTRFCRRCGAWPV